MDDGRHPFNLRLNSADLADIPADQGTDYVGPDSGKVIVGCGGCYSSEPYTCTSSYHGREIEHNGRNATVGFRIVLRPNGASAPSSVCGYK